MHNRVAADDGGGGVLVLPERAVPPEKPSTTRSSRFVAPPAGDNVNDSDLDVSMLEKQSSSSSSYARGVLRDASTWIKQASEQLRLLASFRPSRIDKSTSAATHAIKGLNFICRYDSSAGWPAVESRFEELAQNGLLHRSKIGGCIGTKELAFAGELFDALARRRNISGDSISKAELYEFWEQISDSSFDGRLQTFLDMVDEDADRRIIEEEVKEIITLSAWAGKLTTITQQSEEYARLIMEELDPYCLGYIDLCNLEMLQLQTPSESTTKNRELSEALSRILRPTEEPNPFRRWYRRASLFLEKYHRDSAMSNTSIPEVPIDGPYGAPALDYKQYDVVLLVGLGMGATPMISIIKDIINNKNNNNKRQLNGDDDIESGSPGDASTSELFRTRRAYFYWVTREQASFEWFRGVMEEVAEMDKDGVVELHNHCSSVYEESNAQPAPNLIRMLQSLNHAKHGIDHVFDTRIKTHFGRPD